MRAGACRRLIKRSRRASHNCAPKPRPLDAAGVHEVFRRFRDINCASQQGQAAQANFEVIGQVFLGITPKGRV
jgi:hypothetical protein